MVKMVWFHRERIPRVAMLALGALLAAIAFDGGPALAQTFNSGSTGADGAFNPTTNSTLALPPNGVFNFTTINIPPGVTVTFTRNAANTPVTMLASGNVTISGTIDLSGLPGGAGVQGATSLASDTGAGGPGGFDGGNGANGVVSTTGGPGLGPGGGEGGRIGGAGVGGGGGGGGFAASGGGGFTHALGSPQTALGGGAYGTATLLPLVGGSGGGGGGAPFGNTGSGGGGGGGGLLIASSGIITFTGTLLAKGGTGGELPGAFGAGAAGSGSGGAIRLVATTITGSGGSINVSGGPEVSLSFTTGGKGGAGRIRIEALTNTATANFAGIVPSVDRPVAVVLPNAPSLTITSVAGVAAPTSPTGSFVNPDIVIPASTPNPMTIGLAASNIPLGTAVTVTVKPLNGTASSATSTPLAGTLAASTATGSVTIPTNQPSVISASATFTLAALPGAGPLVAQGEEVELVRVVATLGGPLQIAYITKSGREVVAKTEGGWRSHE